MAEVIIKIDRQKFVKYLTEIRGGNVFQWSVTDYRDQLLLELKLVYCIFTVFLSKSRNLGMKIAILVKNRKFAKTIFDQH